ncbi:hypothetical protein QGN29_00285 [Temperatibacter marinus]|uniref:Uncharacterized protein n=1 Tax=Temperatibacter marinus TaxID=1456591 RepID=A0AA52EHU2_9PROT|nr:hypothetical protein [Temperatibacter marinus]WND02802.1 hypothetical protein QGN29_00285 [Temperatibacter marinus]
MKPLPRLILAPARLRRLALTLSPDGHLLETHITAPIILDSTDQTKHPFDQVASLVPDQRSKINTLLRF